MTQAFPELFPTPSPASCFSLPGPDGWRLIGIDTHDTDASEGWNGDTDDEAFKAHGWDGQGGVVKPTQYGTLYLAVGCALRVCLSVLSEDLRAGWLAEELQAHADARTLLFMHHPPIDMGVARLDDASLETQAEFAGLLEGAPQVEGIFCGHVK